MSLTSYPGHAQFPNHTPRQNVSILHPDHARPVLLHDHKGSPSRPRPMLFHDQAHRFQCIMISAPARVVEKEH